MNANSTWLKTGIGIGALGLAAFAGSLFYSPSTILARSEAGLATQPATAIHNDPDVNHAISFSEAFQKVAKEVTPAVVNITATRGGGNAKQQQAAPNRRGRQQQQPQIDPNDPDEFFRRFFGDPFGGRAPNGAVPESQAFGSGVVVSAEGYILTNNHVVEGAREVKVSFPDKRSMDAKVVGTDPDTDIAVLKIEGAKLPYAALGNSDTLNVGEWVLAIGNPFQLSSTVTAGIISAKGRDGVMDNISRNNRSYQDFIQTDAAINPGNSGGPLVNLRGEVIGINSAIFSRSGGYMGIGFAIPINMAKGVMDQLIATGKVERGWLGVGIQALDETTAKSLNFEGTQGVLVNSVTPKSPAAEAGIQTEDVIVEINGHPTPTSNVLRTIVGQSVPGTTVNVKLMRNGEAKTVSVKLGNLEEALAATGEATPADNKLGLGVQTLTPDVASEKLGDKNLRGVIVTDIKPGSPAEQVGIQPDDILIQLNGKPITDVASFREGLQDAERRGWARVQLRRGNMNLIATVGLR